MQTLSARYVRLYQIVNSKNKKVFYGTTRLTLTKCMSLHRSACKRGETGALYKAMRSLGGINFKIVLIRVIFSEGIDKTIKGLIADLGGYSRVYNSPRFYFSKKQTHDVLKRFKKGSSQTEIAQSLGCSQPTVRALLKRKGVL